MSFTQALLEDLLFLRFLDAQGLLPGGCDSLCAKLRACWEREPDGTTGLRDVLRPRLAKHLPNSVLLAQTDVLVRNAVFGTICEELLGGFTFALDDESEAAIGPEILSDVFDQPHSESGRRHRKLTGTYATPRAVARFMCRQALHTYLITRIGQERASAVNAPASSDIPAREARQIRDLLLSSRVCDPAAGTGALLVAMLHEMTAILERLGDGGLVDDRRHIAENCLHGVDLQGEALEVCKRRLWLALTADGQAPPPDVALLQCDSLLAGSPAFGRASQIDIVLANPPYRSFGLRGSSAAKREWAETVRTRYPGSAEYKLSTYAMFMDLALQIAADQGVVCCITPDSFLLGRYFSKIRRTILDRAAIHRIVLFARDLWRSGVVGRPTISLLQKLTTSQELPQQNGAECLRIPFGRLPAAHGRKAKAFRSSPETVTAALCDSEDALVSGQFREHRYPQTYFHTMPHSRFRLFFSPKSMAFVQAIEANSRPLKEYARITTGVRSRSSQRDVVATECRGPKWKKGLISGRQVLPYRVEWAGDYLHIDPERLYAGGWDPDVVARPKILIRQTGCDLIAAADRDGLYHLNNVHSVSPLAAEPSLRCLCAVLNSRLLNRYYHLISLERGRPMAQTDIETLELLPIADTAPETMAEIDSLVAHIQEPGSRGRVEELLAEAYELGPDLRRYLAQDDLYA